MLFFFVMYLIFFVSFGEMLIFFMNLSFIVFNLRFLMCLMLVIVEGFGVDRGILVVLK